MSEDSDVEEKEDSYTTQMNQYQNQTTMLANTVNFGKTSEENVQKAICVINDAFDANKVRTFYYYFDSYSTGPLNIHMYIYF